jgi:DNA mismatch endonuclease (patch repair protein)
VEFWQAKFKKNLERDACVKDALRAAGWQVLIVWECELKTPARVLAHVCGLLDSHEKEIKGPSVT